MRMKIKRYFKPNSLVLQFVWHGSEEVYENMQITSTMTFKVEAIYPCCQTNINQSSWPRIPDCDFYLTKLMKCVSVFNFLSSLHGKFGRITTLYFNNNTFILVVLVGVSEIKALFLIHLQSSVV